MRHRLATASSVMLLLVCLALDGLWVRSRWFEDHVAYWWWSQDELRRGVIAVGSTTEGIHFMYRQMDFGRTENERRWALRNPMRVHWEYLRASVDEDLPRANLPAGVYLNYDPLNKGIDPLRAIVIPHWLAIAILAVIPVWWIIHVRRHRAKFSAGVCSHCGYDLRATPYRCPECGAVPAAMAAGSHPTPDS